MRHFQFEHHDGEHHDGDDDREHAIHPAKIPNRSSWPAAIAGLTKTAAAFRATFGPRVAQLAP
jgi:hypothetical protein